MRIYNKWKKVKMATVKHGKVMTYLTNLCPKCDAESLVQTNYCSRCGKKIKKEGIIV